MRALLFVAVIFILYTPGCQKNPYTQGEIIYLNYCANCHMRDGSGLAKLIPPLDSSRLTISDPQRLVCVIRNGKPVNPVTGQAMPGNPGLNEVDLTNLINYLGDQYAQEPQAVMVEEVKKLAAGCPPR